MYSCCTCVHVKFIYLCELSLFMGQRLIITGCTHQECFDVDTLPCDPVGRQQVGEDLKGVESVFIRPRTVQVELGGRPHPPASRLVSEIYQIITVVVNVTCGGGGERERERDRATSGDNS